MFIFADGTAEFVTAYRVDVSAEERMIICGHCAGENEKDDPTRVAGFHICERCGKAKGRHKCRDHFCE